MTGRHIVTAAGLGVVLVAAGVLVLLSDGAANVGVDWFADLPESPHDWLDTVRAWNGTRELGAGLVVAGSVLLVAALGVLAGRGRGAPLRRRTTVVAWVVSAALVLGGVVVFAYPRPAEVSYVGVYKLLRPPVEPLPPTNFATMVWTDGQAVAALVALAGLLLGTWCTGLALGRRAGRTRLSCT